MGKKTKKNKSNYPKRQSTSTIPVSSTISTDSQIAHNLQQLVAEKSQNLLQYTTDNLQPPVTEEQVVEEPVTEEQVVEEPVTEQLVTEEQVVEEPVTEQLVTEEQVVEEQIVENTQIVDEPQNILRYIAENDTYKDYDQRKDSHMDFSISTLMALNNALQKEIIQKNAIIDKLRNDSIILCANFDHNNSITRELIDSNGYYKDQINRLTRRIDLIEMKLRI